MRYPRVKNIRISMKYDNVQMPYFTACEILGLLRGYEVTTYYSDDFTSSQNEYIKKHIELLEKHIGESTEYD